MNLKTKFCLYLEMEEVVVMKVCTFNALEIVIFEYFKE